MTTFRFPSPCKVGGVDVSGQGMGAVPGAVLKTIVNELSAKHPFHSPAFAEIERRKKYMRDRGSRDPLPPVPDSPVTAPPALGFGPEGELLGGQGEPGDTFTPASVDPVDPGGWPRGPRGGPATRVDGISLPDDQRARADRIWQAAAERYGEPDSAWPGPAGDASHYLTDPLLRTPMPCGHLISDVVPSKNGATLCWPCHVRRECLSELRAADRLNPESILYTVEQHYTLAPKPQAGPPLTAEEVGSRMLADFLSADKPKKKRRRRRKKPAEGVEGT